MRLPPAAGLILGLGLTLAARPQPAAANYPIFSQRFAADPSPLVHQGRVYVFASHDRDGQRSWDMRDFTCISSDDLVNWTDHGEVFDAPRDTTWANLAWAPVVVERSGRFFLYYTNGRDGTGVAVADALLGPWVDPLGAPLVVNGSYSDPAVLIDDDGTAWLHLVYAVGAILGGDMVSLATPLQGYANSAFPDYKEGGILHRLGAGGRYNLSYSTADLPGYGWSYTQSISRSPDRDFTPGGRWLWLPADAGPNLQGDLFPFAGRWYFVYHNGAVALDRGQPMTFQRSLAIDRVYPSATDGRIAQLTTTRAAMAAVRYLDPYSRVEAETMAAEEAIEVEAAPAPAGPGERHVSDVQDGDWIALHGVDLGRGATALTVRVASAAGDASLELRLDRPDGRLAAACPVPATGGWRSWRTLTCPVTNAAGIRDIYFRFTGGSGGGGDLLHFDWWRLDGGPASGRTPPATVERTVCLRPRAVPAPPSDTVYLLRDGQDGTWSFQALPDRTYLAVTDMASGAIGRSPDAGPGSRFVRISNPDGSWCLRAGNGRFVVAAATELTASFDESVSGSPRLVADGSTRFDIDDCTLDAPPACDLDAVDAGPRSARPTVFGSACQRLDPSLPAGRVAIARPDTRPGARFDRAAPGDGGTVTYYQLGCGCSGTIRLRKDPAAGGLVLE